MKTKRAPHRPPKFTPIVVKRLLDLIAKGVPYSHAQIAVGIGETSFYRKRRDDPEFEAAVQAATAKAIEARLGIIEKAALSGDWRASAWLLEHCPNTYQHFSRNRLEVTGANGGPLTAGVAIYLPKKDTLESLPPPATEILAIEAPKETDENTEP